MKRPRLRRPWRDRFPASRRTWILVEALILIVGLYAAVFVARAFQATPVAPDPDRIVALSSEIGSLEERYSALTAADSLLHEVRGEKGDVVLAIRTGLLQEIATWSARTYLDDVRLHLTPDVVVEEGDEVRAGFFKAGEWTVTVTIREIEARLAAHTITVTVRDSARLGVEIAVDVMDGNGSAFIDFAWDASTVGSIVCRDFEVQERFAGLVRPFEYRLAGAFRFEGTPRGLIAVTEVDRPRMRVSPEPTRESWARVSDLLDHQNNVFRCGLALKPDELMEKLDALLREGFDFRLPASLFRPIRIPTLLDEVIDVRGEPVPIEIVPGDLRMTPEAIWYGSEIAIGGAGPASSSP